MQEGKLRRSNAERSDTMRASLVAAARSLFVEKGYADTGTPEIVEAAGVTRGALYHHFTDKKALFEAVVRSESATVGSEVQNAAPASAAPAQALALGGAPFLEAMSHPCRARLLLLDGPAVLGREAMDAIDEEYVVGALRVGLQLAMDSAGVSNISLDAATALFSAAFDRAALAIAAGGDPKAYLNAIGAMLAGVLASGASPGDG